MAKKIKNLWLWIFIALAILIALLFVFYLKPSQQSMAGGSSGSSGTTPTTTTTTTEAPCERCQPRWGVDKFYWTCTGTCDYGSCYVASGDVYNAYAKPNCYCGQRPTDSGDNCVKEGGFISVPTCGGTCASSSESCQMNIRGDCECLPVYQQSCSTVTAISSPSECNKYSCGEYGQTCEYDERTQICACVYPTNYMIV